MQLRQCGTSGLRVSEIGLGTSTWGRDTDALEAVDMLARFVDAGGTLLEASPLHGEGMAIDVIAAAIERVGRHRVTLAWRGGARPVGDGPWRASGARGDMLRAFDDALARLGTDYVDIWLAEPDPLVPIDETLSACENAVASGRAHYIGLSHADTWDTASALVSAKHSKAPNPVAVEVPLSLLTASATNAYANRCTDEGLGVLAHSPLAGGVLTGKYRHTTPPDSRAASPHMRFTVEEFLTEEYQGIVEAVVRAAQGLDRTPMDVALAWARDHEGVSSAIVGPRTLRQLDQMIDVNEPLPDPIRQVLNEVAGL